MIIEILVLVLITFLPFFELRASIPLGILAISVNLPLGITLHGFGMNWMVVFGVCVLTNAIVGILFYYFIDVFVHYLERIKWFAKFWHKNVERSQAKLKPYVDKYGDIGLAVFIGIPLPGTGAYSGAIGAYVLGMNKKRFAIANFIGVFMAGVLVTAITLAGAGIWKAIFGL